ncbi:hypothetical protein B0H11DRAFT_2202680 [Mycena galericulata]|nr:hypothetical protein B0H11DRAFT_2202680 [Mycena galericulata]
MAAQIYALVASESYMNHIGLRGMLIDHTDQVNCLYASHERQKDLEPACRPQKVCPGLETAERPRFLNPSETVLTSFWYFYAFNGPFNGLIPISGHSGQQGRIGARQCGGHIQNTPGTDLFSSILHLKSVMRDTYHVQPSSPQRRLLHTANVTAAALLRTDMRCYDLPCSFTDANANADPDTQFTSLSASPARAGSTMHAHRLARDPPHQHRPVPPPPSRLPRRRKTNSESAASPPGRAKTRQLRRAVAASKPKCFRGRNLIQICEGHTDTKASPSPTFPLYVHFGFKGQFSNTRYPEAFRCSTPFGRSSFCVRVMAIQTLILCRHIGKPFKRNSTGDNIVGSAGLHHAVKFHLG